MPSFVHFGRYMKRKVDYAYCGLFETLFKLLLRQPRTSQLQTQTTRQLNLQLLSAKYEGAMSVDALNFGLEARCVTSRPCANSARRVQSHTKASSFLYAATKRLNGMRKQCCRSFQPLVRAFCRGIRQKVVAKQ